MEAKKTCHKGDNAAKHIEGKKHSREEGNTAAPSWGQGGPMDPWAPLPSRSKVMNWQRAWSYSSWPIPYWAQGGASAGDGHPRWWETARL